MNTLNKQNFSQDFEQPELNIKEIIFLLRRSWKIIAIATFLAILATLYHAFTVTPVYTSSTSILIDRPQGMKSLFGFPGSVEMTDIYNVIEMVSSRRVAEEVVLELWKSPHRNNLAIFGTRKFHAKGEDFQRVVKEILSFGVYESGALDSIYYVEDTLPDTLFDRFVNIINKGKMIEVENKRDTDILYIKCTSSFPDEAALLANTVTHVFQNLDKEWNAEESLNLRDFLEEQLVKKELELAVAESRLQKYQEQENVFSLDGNSASLLNQLVLADSKYLESMAEVNIQKEGKSFISSKLSTEESTLVAQLQSSINPRLLALRTEIGTKESEQIRNVNLYGEKHEAVRSLGREIDLLKNKLNEETQKLIAQGLSVSDPLEYRQELIKEALSIEASLAEMEVRSREYKKLVDLYSKDLNQLPEKQLQYARLERDRSVVAEIYSFMRQKLEETRISVASEAGNIRIIDTAVASRNRTSPNNRRNALIGLILGIGMGVGIIFLREYLDNTIRSVDYLEKMGLTMLGVIPEVGQTYRRKSEAKSKNSEVGSEKSEVRSQKEGKRSDLPTARKEVRSEDDQEEENGSKRLGGFFRQSGESIRRHLITKEDPKSPVSESYRMIRTNILYSQTDETIKSILVSSPGPGEGKTTTVTNLAITFANLGKRTILIDTDLRRPVVHRVFEIDRDPGVSHYLSGNVSDFNSLPRETDIPNLWVVPAGVSPPNPSELLGSKKMKSLIAQLKSEWDIILFDSPPITAVTDATMISTEVDSMVLVIKAGGTIKESLIRSLHSLKGVSTKLTGAVLNGVSRHTSYDSYYYYYQYYYHYYGGEKKK